MPAQTEIGEVRYNGEPFGTDDQEAATRELIQFWNESNGEMSFREMEEEGEYSRTFYRNMMNEYCEPVEESNKGSMTSGRSDAREAMEGVKIPANPVPAFVMGYQMGREDSE